MHYHNVIQFFLLTNTRCSYITIEIRLQQLFLPECSKVSGMCFAWCVVLLGKSFIDLYDNVWGVWIYGGHPNIWGCTDAIIIQENFRQ